MDRSRRTVLVVVGLVVVLVLGAVIAVVATRRRTAPPDYLNALWQSYKQHDWQSSGRTVDPQSHGNTTSEGQGYTMLRAVWSGDQPTFAATWNWTQHNLQQPSGLFAWLWGSLPNGSTGILTAQGGQNTASDADSDIALALVLAAYRWHQPSYLAAAHTVLNGIWNQEVIMVGNQPYLAADNLEKFSASPTIAMNVSYLSPYAYRVFAKIDPAHNWLGLAANAYTVIHNASQQQIGSKSSANLPPDWVALNRVTGALQPPQTPGQDTNFGFDAFRTIWRVALDWQWFHTAAAKSTLASFSSLTNWWNHSHQLYAVYSHSGKPLVDYSSNAMYGGTLGYFQVIHPSLAAAIYKTRLESLFSGNTLKQPLNYYDNNWVWFGMAMYQNKLTNYTALPGASP